MMSLKFALAAVLFAAALPAAAQPPAASPPAASSQPSSAQSAAAAAIQPAGMAFGQCLQTGMQHVSATVTPEAGATAVLEGCGAQRGALVAAVEAMLATLPADQQAQGRAQLNSQLGEVPAHLAEAIRQQRTAAAAPPATATPAH